jgi:hypothetical protein
MGCILGGSLCLWHDQDMDKQMYNYRMYSYIIVISLLKWGLQVHETRSRVFVNCKIYRANGDGSFSKGCATICGSVGRRTRRTGKKGVFDDAFTFRSLLRGF